MMTDEEKIIRLYEEMYRAMINKDRTKLEREHIDGARMPVIVSQTNRFLRR